MTTPLRKCGLLYPGRLVYLRQIMWLRFLLFVMVVSIAVFSVFKFHAFWAIFLSRVVLIPLIAGLSYELIRLSAPRCQRGVFRIVVMPGLALQRITTKEPSDDQLEVAIIALKEALELDGIKAREAQAAA